MYTAIEASKHGLDNSSLEGSYRKKPTLQFATDIAGKTETPTFEVDTEY